MEKTSVGGLEEVAKGTAAQMNPMQNSLKPLREI